MLYGDYNQPNPPAEIVRAVEKGDIDVGLVWGPLAGYFARTSKLPLRLEPVTPWLDAMQWPMQYDISVGVQKNNAALLKEIDGVLARRAGDIDALLRRYGVPKAG
jgi:mxaJ protein